MKKINAVLSLLISVLLVVHSIKEMLFISGFTKFSPINGITGVIFTVLFSLHAIISICVFFFSREKNNPTQYASLNIGTIIQRILAVAMLILIHTHFLCVRHQEPDTFFAVFNTAVGVFICSAVLACTAFAHSMISFPKALITLGITKSERSRKITETVSRIIFALCGLTCVVLLVYDCLVKGF